jgi:predicted DNA binding CopG/RHH family protein
MKKRKQVTVRLPKVVLDRVVEIAKLAGVPATTVYNVLLATHVVTQSTPQHGGETK